MSSTEAEGATQSPDRVDQAPPSGTNRRTGEVVTGGTRIGYVGSTVLLHFEVRLNGDPMHPMPRLLGPAAGRHSHRGYDREWLERMPLTGAARADAW